METVNPELEHYNMLIQEKNQEIQGIAYKRYI